MEAVIDRLLANMAAEVSRFDLVGLRRQGAVLQYHEPKHCVRFTSFEDCQRCNDHPLVRMVRLKTQFELAMFPIKEHGTAVNFMGPPSIFDVIVGFYSESGGELRVRVGDARAKHRIIEYAIQPGIPSYAYHEDGRATVLSTISLNQDNVTVLSWSGTQDLEMICALLDNPERRYLATVGVKFGDWTFHGNFKPRGSVGILEHMMYSLPNMAGPISVCVCNPDESLMVASTECL